MEKSEQIIELTKAMFKFHSLVNKINKDGQNPFFKSNYATLSHILEEISEPLQQSGLIITQWPEGSDLITLLIHADSGQYFQSSYNMPVAKQNDPQAVGSAISYARRYAVSSILSLNIDDDDANKASGKGKTVIPDARNNIKAISKDTEPDKPWLNGGQSLDKAIEFLKGGGSIQDITKKYNLSKEIKSQLQTVIDGLKP